MNKRLSILTQVLLFLVLTALPQAFARGQGAGATISLLDQEGKPIASLTDGDTVRVQVQLITEATTEKPVSFRISGMDADVAGCTIPAGESGCESQPFDSLGWFWSMGGQAQPTRVIQAMVGGALVASSSEIVVASRPVVMVHGFSSNWEAWSNYLGPQGYLASVGLRGYAVGDGQVAGVMNTGNLAEPTGKTHTIAENAAILGQYIRAVREQTGAQKIDLLVHSLGGLIGRYYIDQLMPDGEVVNLLILGSPMTGTSCANLPVALGFYLPAVLEFHPSYVQEIFNPLITHRRGVLFSGLAGVPLVNPIQSPCTPIPSDLAVSLDSVAGIPMEVTEMPILHTELNTSAEVFRQFVLPHLQTLPGDFITPADPTSTVPEVESVQFTRVYTGHINPGEASNLTISIETNISVASFALYDTSRSLEVQVTGASGKVITLDPVKNGLIEVKDPSSLVYLGYGFDNPKPGAWLVKLTPTDATPASGTDYALTAVFQGGATLAVETSAMTPALNKPVEFTAELNLAGQALAIDKAEMVIRSAEAAPQIINMEKTPDSTGMYAAWEPTRPGLHSVEINASSLAPDGFVIERTAFLAVEVQPGSQQTLMGILIVTGAVVAGGLVVVGSVKLLRRRR